jgi:hypothetical protein
MELLESTTIEKLKEAFSSPRVLLILCGSTTSDYLWKEEILARACK